MRKATTLQTPTVLWLGGIIFFSQLFNVHVFKDVGQAEIHTAEPLVPEPSASDVELPIDKLKRPKSPVLIKYQQNCLKHVVEQFIGIP